MRKGSNLFLQLIILSMDQFAQNILLSGLFGTKSSRYSHKFVITSTNRFNIGNLNLCKGGNCNFYPISPRVVIFGR